MNTPKKKEAKKKRIEGMKIKLKAAQMKRSSDKFKVIQRLRELRKENDLTQEDIAEILGKSTEQIKKYENGCTPVPAAVAYDLATIYNTTPDYILGFSDDRHIINKDNITEKIGLSEQSVNLLHKINNPSIPIVDDLAHSESKKTIDFINYALSHYEEKSEDSVINYTYTIFTLLYDYITFSNRGKFHANLDSGYTSIDSEYILYNSGLTGADLPSRINLYEYTQLITKERIIRALDNMRDFKKKECIKALVEKTEADKKHAKSIPDPTSVNDLESIGLEIVDKDTENNSTTVRKKKKK